MPIPTTPVWAQSSLQSITYYVGYRLAEYYNYHLSEGTLVDEFVRAVQSRLNNIGLTIRERMYRELHADLIEMGQKRADITIYKGDEVYSVLEVKKSDASANVIESDFVKLIEVKRRLPNVRCFLVLISQRNRPNEYITENGVAVINPRQIDGYDIQTIWVAKATDSFDGFENANYACLIEVLRHQEN
jgi:hypothetical protein